MLNAADSLDSRSLGERLRAGSSRPREVAADVLEGIATRKDDSIDTRPR